MGEAQFLVGGSGVSRVGRTAEQLHQSFVGLIECPQDTFPELSGRRLFLVSYDEIDPRDVETIRRELGEALNTQAWSIKIDADGKPTFYPEQTGVDVLSPRRSHTHRDNPPPRSHEVPEDSYEDEYHEHYNDNYDDEDWEWDYPTRPHRHHHRSHRNPDHHSSHSRHDYESHPPPHSRHSHRSTSFAAEYDRTDPFESYPSPRPPSRVSRRNTTSPHHPHTSRNPSIPPYPSYYNHRTTTYPPAGDWTPWDDIHAREYFARTESSASHRMQRPSSSRHNRHAGHDAGGTPPQATSNSQAMVRYDFSPPRRRTGRRRLSNKFRRIMHAFTTYALT